MLAQSCINRNVDIVGTWLLLALRMGSKLAGLSMDSAPFVYLSVLAIILSIVGLFVLREVIRTRKQEKTLNRLQTKLSKGYGDPEDHYELGSVYLEKRLYQLAVTQFKKALEVSETDLPVVSNALGFAYFLMEQYDLAIRHYKDAVKSYPSYVVAWNNLGHAYEKKNWVTAGIEAYESALSIDQNNPVALKRVDSLRKRVSSNNMVTNSEI